MKQEEKLSSEAKKFLPSEGIFRFFLYLGFIEDCREEFVKKWLGLKKKSNFAWGIVTENPWNEKCVNLKPSDLSFWFIQM